MQAVKHVHSGGDPRTVHYAVVREGNNLAPYTPLENIEAMYHTGRELGQLSLNGGDA